MENKTPHQLSFETNLNWLADDRGIVYAAGCNGTIHVSTPAEFGGLNKEWSPEHLLLSAITSCYMATFIGFAKKAKLTIAHLECKAVGLVKIVEGKYKFTHIDIYPKIRVNEDFQFEIVNSVAHKVQHYCLIGNSINAEIEYHTEILKDIHPATSHKPASVF